MIYDPFKSYRAGQITANLIVSQTALENAVGDIGHLVDYDSAHPVYAKVRDALAAVREVRSNSDNVWELARPDRAASRESQEER